MSGVVPLRAIEPAMCTRGRRWCAADFAAARIWLGVFAATPFDDEPPPPQPASSATATTRPAAAAIAHARSLSHRPASIETVEASGIHHVGMAVVDLDEAVRDVRAAVRRPARASRAASRSRASRRRRSGSARAASSCWPRSATTRRSASSSRSAGRACTTSRTRWPTSAPRSAGLAEAGAELIDAEPRQGMFGLEVAFVHPESVHGVLSEVVSDG